MSDSTARRAHHSSRVPLVKAADIRTTPASDATPKTIKIDKKAIQRAQNDELLKNANVQAFLGAIAWAEGGNYHAKFGYGWAPGNWTFENESTHPGAGYVGKTTAAGMYQITVDTWRDHGVNKQGLNDFSPRTQDLIAVSRLRSVGAIDPIVAGDLKSAMEGASKPWAALERGPGLGNRYPKQSYKTYEEVQAKYKALGGTIK